MTNKSLGLKAIFISVCFISSLACGSQNQSGGNSSNIAANNTNSGNNIAVNNTKSVNNRDPKTVCGYLTAFITGEYKISYGDKYSCNNTNPAKTVSGRPQNYGYAAYGNAETIDSVAIMALTNAKYADAAEADEGVAKYGEELWQKVFAAPMPNDIREEILTNKGKAVKTSKKFTGQGEATVSRNPGNGGTYTIRLEVTLPK